MDKTDTSQTIVTDDANVMTLDQLTELATIAASHPAVAPPLRELVPALVALVRSQAEFIAAFEG